MAKWVKTFIKGANGRERKFDNGGSSVAISIPEEALETLGTFTSKGGRKYYTFHIAPLRNGEDQYGNTHSIYRLDKDEDAPANEDVATKKEGTSDPDEWDSPF